MAKKNFMVNLKKDTRAMTLEHSQEKVSELVSEPAPVSVPDPVEIEAAPPKVKKKPGRPKTKTEPEKTINISVPVSLLKKMEIAKAKHGNNLTRYVNAIIKADLDAHFEEYKNIYNILNS